MRSYCAIYVDAGYLLASAATRVTGTSLRRGVQVDHTALIQGLIAQAEAESGMPLLRVNWYDSGGRPGGMPDFHQDDIGLLPRVKLRLGRLSHTGEQKGVDLRMGLDLATYARNRVVDVIYLVSGDDDLTEAVEEAQFHGLQVIIMAVPGPAGRPHAVARNLQREADGVILIEPEVVDASVRPATIPAALIPGSAEPAAADTPAADDAVAAPDGTTTTDTPIGAPGAARPADAGPAEDQLTPAGGKPAAGGGPAGIPQSPAGMPGPRPPAEPTRAPAPPAELPVRAPAAASNAPTPAVLAGRKASGIVVPRNGAPTPTWSTTTGEPARFDDEAGEITEDLIDAVVRQVVTSWCATATPEALISLRRGEPFIPGDLDRTLLLDLSSRSGVYDIDDESRHALRETFWGWINRLKLS